VRTEKREHTYTAILFDVDGTLVDSNDAHADAWVKAFAASGVTVDTQKVRRAIGMGGDKLLPHVSGIQEDSPLGRTIATRRGEIFQRDMLPRVRAFPDAQRLLASLHERGFRMIAASSAKRDELAPLLRIAGADAFFEDATSSDDAEHSKPDADIVHAALQRLQASAAEAIMIGDTPYDIEAAERARVQAVAFRCGGWEDRELTGAIAIYDGPSDLLRHLDESPLAQSRENSRAR